MKIKVEGEGLERILVCEGVMEFGDRTNFAEKVSGLLDRGIMRFHVDFSKVSFVDRMAINELLRANNLVIGRRAKFELVNLNENVRGLMLAQGVLPIFSQAGKASCSV